MGGEEATGEEKRIYASDFSDFVLEAFATNYPGGDYGEEVDTHAMGMETKFWRELEHGSAAGQGAESQAASGSETNAEKKKEQGAVDVGEAEPRGKRRARSRDGKAKGGKREGKRRLPMSRGSSQGSLSRPGTRGRPIGTPSSTLGSRPAYPDAVRKAMAEK